MAAGPYLEPDLKDVVLSYGTGTTTNRESS